MVSILIRSPNDIYCCLDLNHSATIGTHDYLAALPVVISKYFSLLHSILLKSFYEHSQDIFAFPTIYRHWIAHAVGIRQIWSQRPYDSARPSVPVGRSGIGYNITMTSQWARWRLKSPAPPLFAQPFIRAQIKENIKAPRHRPLCGEFTGGPVNSPHKWPVTRKMLPFDDVIMNALNIHLAISKYFSFSTRRASNQSFW